MARAINKLTARTVQTAGPGHFGDGDGLYLIVDPSGARRWMFLYRRNGKQREMGLGGAHVVILGDIGRTKLYELLGAGELRAVKLGRRTLLVEEEVIAYADALPNIATKPAAGERMARRPRS